MGSKKRQLQKFFQGLTANCKHIPKPIKRKTFKSLFCLNILFGLQIIGRVCCGNEYTNETLRHVIPKATQEGRTYLFAKGKFPSCKEAQVKLFNCFPSFTKKAVKGNNIPLDPQICFTYATVSLNSSW